MENTKTGGKARGLMVAEGHHGMAVVKEQAFRNLDPSCKRLKLIRMQSARELQEKPGEIMRRVLLTGP